MRVDRAPLTAVAPSTSTSLADDPAALVYKHSKSTSTTTWDNLGGWLRNLASTMRVEQIAGRVDVLHPVVSSTPSTTKDWACPLRRLSFWTQVTSAFSPLVPSPVRSARLFGSADRDMLHGTRSHPTQTFRSLYTKLADASTSNGFCFCVDTTDCQVSSSGECSLSETIRSMYDQKWRTSKLLTDNDRVCSQQLDWPFVGGSMRDGSVASERYSDTNQLPTEDAGRTCAVMDRLPKFQYR